MTRLRNFTRPCALVLVCVAAAIAAAAQSYTVISTFDDTNGAQPYAPLVQGLDGYLYGTTYIGGVHNLGTIFKTSTDGALTTLYSFCIYLACNNGRSPVHPLTLATNGKFAGTTPFGGPNGGTIFEITPSGTLTVGYRFCLENTCPTGAIPTEVVEGFDRNFYGMTKEDGLYGQGTIFKITPTGAFTTIYNFCAQTGCPDGAGANAGLILGRDGNFYGTTTSGGSSSGCTFPLGCGTVFKVTPQGALTTLYTFCSQANCVDGAEPEVALLQASDGSFYGTTWQGGLNDNGTLFRITASGEETTFYKFCEQQPSCPDGANPYSSLIQATDGNLYGTTSGGGANHEGTIFKVSPGGALTTLYSFCAQTKCTDGSNPSAALVQHTNGTFYGTTESGGANFGTIYSFSVGLGPFVKSLPGSSPVGKTVIIMGQELTGTSAVAFNGTFAAFTVDSDTYLTATVPPGATTGTIAVTTPSGTLLSNVAFQVLP